MSPLCEARLRFLTIQCLLAMVPSEIFYSVATALLEFLAIPGGISFYSYFSFYISQFDSIFEVPRLSDRL